MFFYCFNATCNASYATAKHLTYCASKQLNSLLQTFLPCFQNCKSWSLLQTIPQLISNSVLFLLAICLGVSAQGRGRGLRVMVWGVSALIEYVSGHWLKCALGLEAMVQLTVGGCFILLDWNVCWGCLLNCNGLLCSRALDSNMHCVEAMVYQILHMLCKEGTYSEVNFNLIYL